MRLLSRVISGTSVREVPSDSLRSAENSWKVPADKTRTVGADELAEAEELDAQKLEAMAEELRSPEADVLAFSQIVEDMVDWAADNGQRLGRVAVGETHVCSS
jgi:hypothetical protein